MWPAQRASLPHEYVGQLNAAEQRGTEEKGQQAAKQGDQLEIGVQLKALGGREIRLFEDDGQTGQLHAVSIRTRMAYIIWQY